MRFPGQLLARLWLLLLGAALVVAVAACASTSPARAASGAPVLPAQDPFYTYTASLSRVAPGTVLRSRVSSFTLNGQDYPFITTQVLYRTTDELGTPGVTVATVIRPLVALSQPKLISYQMAYDGLITNCDPSFAVPGGTPTESSNASDQSVMLGMLQAGYTIVTSDYEDEGLDFAAGREEGYGTLDGIRAAESVLSLPASTPVALIGYSGGAIATDWAAELAGAYAPKLNIVGTAMGGVAVDLAHNLTYTSGSSDWGGVIPAVLTGIARAFKIDLSPYLSAYGSQVLSQAAGTCLQTDLGADGGLTYAQMFTSQYASVDRIPALASALNTLIMGSGGVPREPLYIGVGDSDGTGDGVILTGDDEALAHAYCQAGVTVQFTEYAGDDHQTAGGAFVPAAESFLANRLSGGAAPDGCASIGVGNSLAPLAVTTPKPTARIYHLHLRFTSVSGRDVRLRLRAYGSAINGVTVTLLSSRPQTLASTKLNAARDRLLTVRLAATRTLAAGRYRLVATVAGQSLASTTFTVRRRKEA